MICPQCSNSILSPSLPRPFVLSYRGFKKEAGSEVYLECSLCPYESLEPLNSTVDVDYEMVKFKREVNMRLSEGDDV